MRRNGAGILGFSIMAQVPPKSSQTHLNWHLAALLAVLVLAAVLRLWNLGGLPAGLNVDEASNAWNAYTLLKTGADQHGVSWPIFYTRAFGENRSTTYIYSLLPFQAVGGLNIFTTRLPAALGGVLTVWLVFFVAGRLFDRQTALIAALLLALNPWHLQVSRLGLEASLSPLLILGFLAALIWAELISFDTSRRPPKVWAVALAGLLLGIACYGYWALRIFMPLWFLGLVMITWKEWRSRLKSREGWLGLGAFALAVAVTVLPLAWRHLTDPRLSSEGRFKDGFGMMTMAQVKRSPRCWLAILVTLALNF